MWGGSRLANFVSLNIFGPELHSIYRWRKTEAVKMESGLSVKNFEMLASIYANTKQCIKIPTVPVLLAEDETGIVASVDYFADSDTLQGFCGKVSSNHKCTDNCEIYVGDDEVGYNNIVSAFQDYKIGTHARAVIVNPLHPDLPKIAILINATCNRFNSEFVREQWNRLECLYEAHLLPVIGPLIGHSSDGDSRRRSLMVQDTVSTSGTRFQPIPYDEGFIFTCSKIPAPDGSYTISELHDQDYIHNHKKIINHLHHATRTIRLGPYTVHSNYIVLVHDVFHFDDHGLSQEDILRNDRQNWISAQRVTSQKVLDRLGDLAAGRVPGRAADGSVIGTKGFLQMVWYYVEIFCSSKASLCERIKYAACNTFSVAQLDL